MVNLLFTCFLLEYFLLFDGKFQNRSSPPVPVEIIVRLAQVDPNENSTSPMVDEEEEITEVLEVSETPSEETKINTKN